MPVKVCAASVLATVALVDGKVIVVESVPASVRELLAVRVLPSAIVSVEPVAGAVRVTLLMVVAVATPNVGVVNVGEVAKTRLPVPVAPVEVTPSKSKWPVTARPFVPIVAPPIAKEVAVATPKAGVIRLGEVCIATTVPVPVSVYSPKTPALS
jgi:hypothetical protein